ncbi:MAG: helix-turn-helix domain-containing protein [Candidatus Omnitrophica bacterium]|nr:helix-turn-helix domain-containing protein [Candidatus Omnitrophota bacterium]
MKSAASEILKETREAKGLSLEDVSVATKINSRVLGDIESGAFEKLPAEVYVKSFLKEYADFLGLNAQEVLSRYQQAPPSSRKKQISVPKEQDVPLAGPPAAKKRNKPFPVLPALMAVGGIVILIGGGYAVTAINQRIKELKQAGPVSFRGMVDSRSAPLLIPRNIPLEVTLRAVEPTWVQVRVDDQMVFQNILAKDSFEVWYPKQKAELWVGNAGGVEILLNKKFLGSPGKKGQVIKGIVLSREGMRIL